MNFCFLTLTFSPNKMDMNLISDRLSTASIKYLNWPSPVFGRFQNGCNKVVIEPHVVQFRSEIILVIINYAYDFSPNCTPLSSIISMNQHFCCDKSDCNVICNVSFSAKGVCEAAFYKMKIFYSPTEDVSVVLNFSIMHNSWRMSRMVFKGCFKKSLLQFEGFPRKNHL